MPTWGTNELEDSPTILWATPVYKGLRHSIRGAADPLPGHVLPLNPLCIFTEHLQPQSYKPVPAVNYAAPVRYTPLFTYMCSGLEL